MKQTKHLSPGAEKLRSVIREIYSPIDWSKVNTVSTDFLTTDLSEMTSPEEILFTARSLSLELSAPLSQVLRLVHKGLVRPSARSTNGGMLFTRAQVSEVKKHLTAKP
jgi:hypothetical protein